MANVQFRYGNSQNISSVSADDGILYFTTDGQLFRADGNGLLKISDIYLLETEAERGALTTAIDKKFYFVKETNKLYFYFNSTWNEISGGTGTSSNDAYSLRGIDLDITTGIQDRYVYAYDSSVSKFTLIPLVSGESDKGSYETSYTYTIDNKVESETIVGDKYSRIVSYTYYDSGADIGKLHTEVIVENGKTITKTYTYIVDSDLISNISVTVV